MAIVANLAIAGAPASANVFYRQADILDPHLNTVNTGCGTDIVGTFPTSDARGGLINAVDTGIVFPTQSGGVV